MIHEVYLVGVHGYGAIYPPRLEALEKAGMLRFAGAVIRRECEEAAQLRAAGRTVFPSTDELFRQVPGKGRLLLLPVGIGAHCPLTCAGLERGFSVLVEKPAAGSVADAEKMIAAEQAAKEKFGSYAAVAFQHIAAREIHDFKRMMLPGGALGAPKEIITVGIWPRNDGYYRRNDWAGKMNARDGAKLLDSPANNAFAHYLNLALFLCGERFDASAEARDITAELYRARPEIETFDSCFAEFTAGKARVRAGFSHTGDRVLQPVVKGICEYGSFEYTNESWHARRTDGTLIAEGASSEPPMLADACVKIDRPEHFLCPLTVALEHTKLIERITLPEKAVAPADAFLQSPEGQWVTPEICDRIESLNVSL